MTTNENEQTCGCCQNSEPDFTNLVYDFFTRSGTFTDFAKTMYEMGKEEGAKRTYAQYTEAVNKRTVELENEVQEWKDDALYWKKEKDELEVLLASKGKEIEALKGDLIKWNRLEYKKDREHERQIKEDGYLIDSYVKLVEKLEAQIDKEREDSNVKIRQLECAVAQLEQSRDWNRKMKEFNVKRLEEVIAENAKLSEKLAKIDLLDTLITRLKVA